MEIYEKMEDQEIWKSSFALACFIYWVTDRESFCMDRELRRRSRKLMARVLSSVIESFETGNQIEAGDFLRKAVISLVDLRQLLITSYQRDCLSFQEFCNAREQCRKLSSQLLDPGLERRGSEAGAGLARISHGLT